jgi:hypothetical protein
MTIAGYEVELNDLKGAANYAMDCIAVLAEEEEANPSWIAVTPQVFN